MKSTKRIPNQGRFKGRCCLRFVIGCLLVIVCCSALPSALAQPRRAWVNRYSLNPAKTNQTTAMVLAPDGNIVIAGSSANASNDLDYVLVKYTPDGVQQWLTRYDSPTNGNDQLKSMALDTNGNIAVTGSSKTAKFDNDGNLLWTAPYAGLDVAINTSHVYVTGFSTVDFATAKLSGENGTNIWSRMYDKNGYNDQSQVITVDQAGNVYVGGYYTHTCVPPWGFCYPYLLAVKYDANGNQSWEALANSSHDSFHARMSKLVLDDAGNCFATGDERPGSPRVFSTSKISTNGTVLWSYYGDTDGEGIFDGQVEDMALAPDGNLLLTGRIDQNNTYCTIKLEPHGHKVWLVQYQGSDTGRTNLATALSLDSADNVYVTGYSPNLGSGYDITTIKYDKDGNEKWVIRYNSPANGDDIATGIIVDKDDNIYVTGYSTTAAGGTEFVTIKYTEDKLRIERKTDGSMLLKISTVPGQVYSLETSTNLQNWTSISTNIADTNGLVQFDHTNAPPVPYRFYRSTSAP